MDWQRDYWFGLILILPPEKIRTSIDALRHQFDPESAATCPAHISLSDPLSGEMTQEHTREIRHILSSIDPFTLHFEKPHASPERAGVSYPITPQEPIDALKDALHTVSVFNDQPYGRRGIPAHVTIAEFITIEESQSICEELQLTAPSGSFLCDRLSFIVPDDNFHF